MFRTQIGQREEESRDVYDDYWEKQNAKDKKALQDRDAEIERLKARIEELEFMLFNK